MKKIITILLVMLMALTVLPVSAFAAEPDVCVDTTDNNLSVYENEEYVVSYDDTACEIISNGYSGDVTTMDIDYIILNSTNVISRGTSVSGSYTSSKYDAGLAGYKYRISFDWTAKVNSEGDYIFDKISNPKITTYENWFLLGFTWSYYNYSITRNVYYKSNGGKSLTFETNYSFVVYDDYGFDYNFSQENVKVVTLDSIR